MTVAKNITFELRLQSVRAVASAASCLVATGHSVRLLGKEVHGNRIRWHRSGKERFSVTAWVKRVGSRWCDPKRFAPSFSNSSHRFSPD